MHTTLKKNDSNTSKRRKPRNLLLLFILLLSFAISNSQDTDIYYLDIKFSGLESNVIKHNTKSGILDTFYRAPTITDFYYDDALNVVHVWDELKNQIGVFDVASEQYSMMDLAEQVIDVEWDVQENKIFAATLNQLITLNLQDLRVLDVLDFERAERVISIDRERRRILHYSPTVNIDTSGVYRTFDEFDYDYSLMNTTRIDNHLVNPQKIKLRNNEIYYVQNNFLFTFKDSVQPLFDREILDFEIDRDHEHAIISTLTNRLDSIGTASLNLSTGELDSIYMPAKIFGFNIQLLSNSRDLILSPWGKSNHLLLSFNLNQRKFKPLIHNPFFDVRQMKYNPINKEISWITIGDDYYAGTVSNHLYSLLPAGDLVRKDISFGRDKAYLDARFNDSDYGFYTFNNDSVFYFNEEAELIRKIGLGLPRIPFGVFDIDVKNELVYRIPSKTDLIQVYSFKGDLQREIKTKPIRGAHSLIVNENYKVLAIRDADGIIIQSIDSIPSYFTIPLFDGTSYHMVFNQSDSSFYFAENCQLRWVDLYKDRYQFIVTPFGDFNKHNIFYPHTNMTSSTQYLQRDEDNTVVVYPNPTSERLTINSDHEIHSVRWIDHSGSVVQSQEKRIQGNHVVLSWPPEVGSSALLQIITAKGMKVVPMFRMKQ